MKKSVFKESFAVKETYEAIEMEIREIPEEDVITVSGINKPSHAPEFFSMHDNSYVDWASFM